MNRSRRGTVDIVMLGSFGVWTRGTLQARALPMARSLASNSSLRFAIVTTPWDDPKQAGLSESIDGVRIYNTRSTSPSCAPAAAAEQLNMVRKLKPALVHVMKPKAFAGLAGALLRISSARPILMVDHDDWEGDGGWNDAAGYNIAARRLFSFQERQLLAAADGVTAASTLLEERARRIRLCRGDALVTFLPNGLDEEWGARLRGVSSASSVDRPPALVLYSRFAEFSMGWLARMLDRLDSLVDRPIDLHIIGMDETQSRGLEQMRRIRPIWYGYASKTDIPELLAQATIALYPYEDNLINRSKQSVKLLELMAAGCAVVASDVGDIQRIGGKSIRAVGSQGIADYAKAVSLLVNNPAEAAALGEAAQLRAAEYTTHRLASKLLDTYTACGLNLHEER